MATCVNNLRSRRRAIPAWVRTITVLAIAAVADGADQETKTVLANQEKLTNRIRTLPYEKVLAIENTDPYGLYVKDRVTSPLAPVVVRQDGPAGPKYQEALGYTFLLNSVKFSGLARMDDGKLVLSLSALTR